MLAFSVSTLAQVLSLYAASWIISKLLKRFVIKSPLDVLAGPPSESFLTGNIGQLLDVSGWAFNRHILQRYGGAIRVKGVLGARVLVISDPKALHHVLVKDQYDYEPIGFISRNAVYFGPGLLGTLGEQHKKQRRMMNPVFSINHMRGMIPLFYEVTERLRTTLTRKVKDGPQELDILWWMTRTALELIGQSGMGYSFDPLVDDRDHHPYPRSIKKLSLLMGGPFGFITNQIVFPFAANFDFPRLKRFIVDHTPMRRVQEITEVVDLMHKTTLDIIQAKKNAMNSSDPAVVAEMMEKKDIITILMKANLLAEEGDRLSDEEVCGQVSTFVLAGMETTSSALSRILQLLASHPDVQTKLRNEIREAQANGRLTYDQLVSLPYLDAVCRETLRVYPPINNTAARTARKDMALPLSKPVLGADGKEVTEIMVPEGTDVIVSVLGSNTNPDLWGADALEWKPERWLSPLPGAVGEAHMPGIYSHLMTFLGGSRACIGFKFSQLEMKVVLSVLLSSFQLEAAKKHEITWKMTGVAGPYVDSLDNTRPQLPVILSLVDGGL
ncbi:cytochrome P450 [Macrolepiota fuliginosa MF-IS2]|uniref:Cytochrome P450 n=1 Tax=Macrolepiota fuliginosa MF-IS2 TaxID=1400762 RepID=A0A9P5XC88_9AGAR|nr:cytochrome P450 [Macrolepiota fuliginosa MF-IS2]